MKVETTPHFVEIIQNTLNDFINQGLIFLEDLEILQEIIDTKKISLVGATSIYQIIDTRKKNIKLVKKLTDTETFKIVNKEHKYLENYLNKHFKNDLEYYYSHNMEATNVIGSVSLNEVA